MAFKIHGKVIEKETGKGIPNLKVKAIDKDLLFDDLLGAVTTDENGNFEIKYDKEDFRELFFDKKPDIYLKIKNPEGEVIHTTEDKVRYEASRTEEFIINISKNKRKMKNEKMKNKKVASVRDWVEPAHSIAIKLHDDLVVLYTHIREKYQKGIDQAFDRVSQQIGFVVTTTVPVVFEVGGNGKVKRISMGAEHLKDTLFDRELTTALKNIYDDRIPTVSAGTYNMYLLWFDALKLKFRTEWMEPAHVAKPKHWLEPAHFQLRRGRLTERAREVVWESHEPAHWFDPGITLSAEEAVVISVIDEVYPELQLADRIGSYSNVARKMVHPEVMEPAHFRDLRSERAQDVLSELASVLRRYGY